MSLKILRFATIVCILVADTTAVFRGEFLWGLWFSFLGIFMCGVAFYEEIKEIKGEFEQTYE